MVMVMGISPDTYNRIGENIMEAKETYKDFYTKNNSFIWSHINSIYC
jgi:hypothetical protein